MFTFTTWAINTSSHFQASKIYQDRKVPLHQIFLNTSLVPNNNIILQINPLHRIYKRKYTSQTCKGPTVMCMPQSRTDNISQTREHNQCELTNYQYLMLHKCRMMFYAVLQVRTEKLMYSTVQWNFKCSRAYRFSFAYKHSKAPSLLFYLFIYQLGSYL